uniref:helicase-related protein n=1 Tax=uncultured Bacteroides sp. TaxID=162156 RepID=UPI00338FF843
LEDLWAQIYLLDEGARLGKTMGAYRDRYFIPGKRNRTTIFSYTPKDGSFDMIKQAISDICISMKAEDYLTLPDVIFNDIPVALDAAAAKAYSQLENDLLLQVDENMITAQSAGVLTGKLLQLCNGAIYDEDRNAVKIHDCKVDAFLELVEQLNGQHALVFYNFQHDRDRLLEALSKYSLRVRVYSQAKDEADWNNGEIDILLAHPASCGYGLNLQQGGHHAVWFGLTWSLEQYEQANKRLHRQGQEHPVVIHHLVVQSGMDAAVLEALTGKADMQNALMDALRVRINKLRS